MEFKINTKHYENIDSIEIKNKMLVTTVKYSLTMLALDTYSK